MNNLVQLPGVGLLFILIFIASLIRPEETKKLMSSTLFVWIMSGILGMFILCVTFVIAFKFWWFLIIPVGLGLLGKKMVSEV